MILLDTYFQANQFHFFDEGENLNSVVFHLGKVLQWNIKKFRFKMTNFTPPPSPSHTSCHPTFPGRKWNNELLMEYLELRLDMTSLTQPFPPNGNFHGELLTDVRFTLARTSWTSGVGCLEHSTDIIFRGYSLSSPTTFNETAEMFFYYFPLVIKPYWANPCNVKWLCAKVVDVVWLMYIVLLVLQQLCIFFEVLEQKYSKSTSWAQS